MMQLRLLPILLALCALQAGVAAEFPSDYLAYFPQVARGSHAGLFIETLLTISNSDLGQTRVELGSFDQDLLSPTEFTLAPSETRQIRISGEELTVGWIRLVSERVISASALIRTSSTPESEQALSEVSVLAQPPGSKFVVPVFRNADGIANTGLALALNKPGRIAFTLFDPAGRMLASTFRDGSLQGKPRADFSHHLALFVEELFADFPAEFTEGSLLVENISFGTPMMFSVLALYTQAERNWLAPVTKIDITGGYRVTVKENEQQSLEELANLLGIQYGFSMPDLFLDEPPSFSAFHAGRRRSGSGKRPENRKDSS